MNSFLLNLAAAVICLLIAFAVLVGPKVALEMLLHPFKKFRIVRGAFNNFPGQVNVQPAVGVAGDFCDANPRYTVDSGSGGFVTGANGCTVGRFAWADSAFATVSNTGVGTPTGFVHREQQALTTAFLAEGSMVIPAGLVVTLFNGGGFWAKNDGTTTSAIGNKAYANNATGQVSFGATGAPTQGGTSSASTIAVNAGSTSTIAVNSFTGSIAGTVLTVSAVATGAMFPGQTLSGGSSGTGVINPATKIVAQLTGSTGAAGTYSVSVSQTVLSTTITGSGGTLTVGGAVTGVFVAGQTLTGTGVTAGTTVLSNISGTGGAGTYAVSIAQTTASTAITASGGTLTVGGAVTGVFALNNLITGASVSANSSIIGNASTSSNFTGAGGAGTYQLNVGQTLTSQAININSTTETKWVAQSVGAVGELVRMTTQGLG